MIKMSDRYLSQNFGGLLHEECTKRDWSLSELARRSGVNEGTLRRIKRGITRKVRDKTLVLIANALDTDFGVLGLLVRRAEEKDE